MQGVALGKGCAASGMQAALLLPSLPSGKLERDPKGGWKKHLRQGRGESWLCSRVALSPLSGGGGGRLASTGATETAPFPGPGSPERGNETGRGRGRRWGKAVRGRGRPAGRGRWPFPTPGARPCRQPCAQPAALRISAGPTMKALLFAVLAAVLCVERGKGWVGDAPATTVSPRGPPVLPQPWVWEQIGGEGCAASCRVGSGSWRFAGGVRVCRGAGGGRGTELSRAGILRGVCGGVSFQDLPRSGVPLEAGTSRLPCLYV